MCIKFGESVNDREKIMLNDLQIAWVNDVITCTSISRFQTN